MSGRLIVVVEDDEDDFFFTRRELRKYTPDPIVHLDSGRAAIDYLAGEGAYRNRSEFPLPDLMFLDLKMDHVSGLDVLDWIRAHLGEKAPKLYVLTGSNEPRDRARVKDSGVAAGYFVKPLTAASLAEIFGTPAKA
jgi:CheY-like chemotaxis protein